MSTADASRERVLIAQVQLLPALWPSQRTASLLAWRYLCRGADPERGPSRRKPHTARPSAAGVSGRRNTQIHWCRLSSFHCRLPGERGEEKNQSHTPDAERPPTCSDKTRRFCRTLAKEFKKTSQSLVVTTQHVPGCFSHKNLAISLEGTRGIPQSKVQCAAEKEV